MSKAPDWSTGLHGCLDIKTESLLDPWNYTPCFGLCGPCYYTYIRKMQLEAAPGEHLYCVENSCGSNVWFHAFVQTLWCLTCPPVNGGMNRRLIRTQAGIPGTFVQDMALHAFYSPCALAQEARHIYGKGYQGEPELRLPYWRSMLVSLFPLHDLNRRLLKASNDGHLEQAKEVLRLGADPNVRQAHSGSTPLMYAAHAGHAQICLELIKYKANPNLEDRVGLSAMHRAAQMGHGELLSEIWAKGGNVQRADSWGRSPEDYATGKARDTVRGILGRKESETVAFEVRGSAVEFGVLPKAISMD